ncbi:hypothetical protein CXX78_01595 [Candidatus Parvarchaeota archaeon]|nr:MAG: hypothetical protein CXX78_01595 [Candidatus Parvarchaeota archaeon]
MLMKTHLAIGAFAALFFLQQVSHKSVFIVTILIASLLPDIDSGFSTLGRKKIFKLIQMFTKHRGLFHSFTFCIVFSIFLAFYFPIFAFPFFLGYALHLFADAWTIDGIRPFWPTKHVSKGKVRVGSPLEDVIFVIFCILNILALSFYIMQF